MEGSWRDVAGGAECRRPVGDEPPAMQHLQPPAASASRCSPPRDVRRDALLRGAALSAERPADDPGQFLGRRGHGRGRACRTPPTGRVGPRSGQGTSRGACRRVIIARVPEAIPGARPCPFSREHRAVRHDRRAARQRGRRDARERTARAGRRRLGRVRRREARRRDARVVLARVQRQYPKGHRDPQHPPDLGARRGGPSRRSAPRARSRTPRARLDRRQPDRLGTARRQSPAALLASDRGERRTSLVVDMENAPCRFPRRRHRASSSGTRSGGSRARGARAPRA